MARTPSSLKDMKRPEPTGVGTVVDMASRAASIGMPADTPVGAMVERMAGLGLPPGQIASILGIAEHDVRTKYSASLNLGRAKANLKVANAAFMVATDQSHPKFATMSIFWQRAHMGLAGSVPSDEDDEVKATRIGDVPYRKPSDRPDLSQPEVTARFDALIESFKPKAPKKRA